MHKSEAEMPNRRDQQGATILRTNQKDHSFTENAVSERIPS